MRIVGIDPDTKQISAVLMEPGKPPVIWQWAVKGHRAEERFARLWEEFSVGTSFDAGWPSVDWVWIEAPIFVHNHKSLRDQAQVVGFIRARFMSLHVPHGLVDNETWKKGLLGNGHATKEEIAAYATAILQLPTGLPQDAYDAACIAAWGLQNVPKGDN